MEVNRLLLVLKCLLVFYQYTGSEAQVSVEDLQKEILELKMATALELQALKTSFADEIQALKASSANELKVLKTTYADEIQHLKLTFTNEIRDLKISSADEIQALKTSTADEIQDLKTSTADEIQDLKTSYDREIQALKTSSEALKTLPADEMKILKDDVNALKIESQNRASEMQRRFILEAESFTKKPAFSAALSKPVTGLGTYQAIIFDDVFTNDLGAYSGVTGIFIAPMNGTYFFTATVMNSYGEQVESEICLNGVGLVQMYSGDTDHEQGSNSAVLVLKAGDRVWVRHYYNVGTNAHGYHWSSFSGFMI